MGQLHEARQLGGPDANVQTSSAPVREVLRDAVGESHHAGLCCVLLADSLQRFLRALGFGSVMGRSPEVDEDIQMHADSLFQRMLKHEAAVEQAKQSGAPIPVFEVVLPKAKAGAAAPSETLARQWREGLEKLPEAERAVEEAAQRADLEAKAEVAANVHKVLKAQREERDARMAEGQATLFDGIVALFGGGGK